MLETVYTDQGELLRTVVKLYCPDGFQLDSTYSTGGFYRDTGVPIPELRYDISPRSSFVEQADCRELPLPSLSVRTAIFDPPFIHAAGKESIMGNRFGSYPSQKLLMEMYYDALAEHRRIFVRKGILVFKCQDIVQSGKQEWTHVKIHRMADELGFEVLDNLILVTRSKIVGHNWQRQVHAHKTHSYFLVLQKGKLMDRDLLREQRLELGLSQEEVAALVGVSKQEISAWELGGKNPTMKNLKQLAQVLSLSVDMILKED